MDAADFFATARERQTIYLRRQAGQPWPWTDDPVMRQYSITNVFRENDKTTRWFREHVRDPLRDDPDVLLATVLFRWWNRISTGEAIFRQTAMFGQDGSPVSRATAWGCRGGKAREWVRVLRASIVAYCGRGPYVTGSYIILGQQGMPKLDGVLACVEQFCIGEWKWVGQEEPESFGEYAKLADWQEVAHFLLQNRGKISLETVWSWLRQVPYLGDFMAYEIVTDLRHTALLDQAPDIMTWGNPGPGAARGLARLHGREIEGRKIKKPPKAQMIAEMRELLALSRDPAHWPQIVVRPGKPYHLKDFNAVFTNRDMQLEDQWPVWELHEVEMWLCEYDKIMRARTGQGRPRGVYRPS